MGKVKVCFLGSTFFACLVVLRHLWLCFCRQQCMLSHASPLACLIIHIDCCPAAAPKVPPPSAAILNIFHACLYLHGCDGLA